MHREKLRCFNESANQSLSIKIFKNYSKNILYLKMKEEIKRLKRIDDDFFKKEMTNDKV